MTGLAWSSPPRLALPKAQSTPRAGCRDASVRGSTVISQTEPCASAATPSGPTALAAASSESNRSMCQCVAVFTEATKGLSARIVQPSSPRRSGEFAIHLTGGRSSAVANAHRTRTVRIVGRMLVPATPPEGALSRWSPSPRCSTHPADPGSNRLLDLLPGRRYSSSSSSVRSTATKAACGISTEPTIFIFFLPSFCFSRSLRLRVMSPP
jgi:hypothetical protein